MFDNLSNRLDGIVKRLRGKGRLTESDVDEVMREIRAALLEADVNVTVVRSVCNRIREHATGATQGEFVSGQAEHLRQHRLSDRRAICRLRPG